MNFARCVVAAIVTLGMQPARGDDATIEISPALVTLIDQLEIPAQTAGPLAVLTVREGDAVKAGQKLGRIDDTEAQLDAEQAATELEIATAEANNDLEIRFAQKTTEVAKAELKRATESVEKFDKSVSQTEIDRLTLAAEQAALQTDQSRHEQAVAALELKLKRNALEQARHEIERRALVAPIDGVIVQIRRHTGEWVEPGATVLRIVRMDRLRVEGFATAEQAATLKPGAKALLEIQSPDGGPAQAFAGTVTFVSPEVDPVNGQARIWAEVENSRMALRPGVKGRLQIITPPRTAGE